MKIKPKVLFRMLNSQLRHQVQIYKNHKIRILLLIIFCYICHLLLHIIVTPTKSKSSIEKMLRTSDKNVWSQNFSLIATNCKEYIRKSRYYHESKIFVWTLVDHHHILCRQLLHDANVSYDCSVLAEESCEETYQRLGKIGAATSVYNRSVTCDIELPEYSSISLEEESYPLAYAITAYMDSRNLELLLASIFRPHNSYCLHIDPFSDELFRWDSFNRFNI